MKKPEDEGRGEVSAENGLYVALKKNPGRESQRIQGKLIQGTFMDMLNVKADEETGANVLEALTAKYIDGLMKNGVTSKDMLAIQKLVGEDVSRSQSVHVKVDANKAAEKSTQEYLKGISGDGQA